jgi:hypothetical protein
MRNRCLAALGRPRSAARPPPGPEPSRADGGSIRGSQRPAHGLLRGRRRAGGPFGPVIRSSRLPAHPAPADVDAHGSREWNFWPGCAASARERSALTHCTGEGGPRPPGSRSAQHTAGRQPARALQRDRRARHSILASHPPNPASGHPPLSNYQSYAGAQPRGHRRASCRSCRRRSARPTPHGRDSRSGCRRGRARGSGDPARAPWCRSYPRCSRRRTAPPARRPGRGDRPPARLWEGAEE